MDPEEYLHELEQALEEYRFHDVERLTYEIVPSAFTEEQAKATLRLMRGKRLFGEMEKTASLFFMAGHQAPEIQRQWAQALIDQNRLDQGLSALQTMTHVSESDPREGSEVIGLTGRAYKQRYVGSGTRDDLIKGIRCYQQGWLNRKGDYRWHGINLAALLTRADQDGVDPGVKADASRIATQIKQEINILKKKEVWDYGTAMEASILAGDKKETLQWAQAYARHREADAFQLAGTLRQMREIWKLDGTELGDALLPVLEYELLQREGSQLELTSNGSQTLANTGFQAVYGTEGSINLRWMDTMRRMAESVARVFDTAEGKAHGTGFLVTGSVLREAWGDEPVFVTNAHVISENPADEAPLRPGYGSAEFTRSVERPSVELGELLFSSPKIDLDVSVFRIEPPAGLGPVKESLYSPVVAGEDERPQRIFVIGHPQGGELAVSLYNNELVGYQDPYVHYRSPTEPGSSGSPVFTRQWRAFALHHRTIEVQQVNEGVLLKRIKQAASS